MSALSDDQQRSLDDKKGQIRLDNEKYLRDHPELRQMTSVFLARVLARQFAAQRKAACVIICLILFVPADAHLLPQCSCRDFPRQEEKPADVLEFAATFFAERQYEVNE